MDDNQKKMKIRNINLLITFIYLMATILFNQKFNYFLNLGFIVFFIAILILIHAICLYLIVLFQSIINIKNPQYRSKLEYFAHIYLASFLLSLIIGFATCSFSTLIK